MFRSRRARALVLVAGVAAAVALGWWLFPSNARRIRTRFYALATLVSIPPVEQDLERLARARRFGSMLAGDIAVTFDDGGPAVNGRDALVLLVAGPPSLTGGLKVELTDVAVQVASGGHEGVSTGLARLTYTDPQTKQLTAEAHRVTLDWRKVDGEWLVQVARVGPAMSVPVSPPR